MRWISANRIDQRPGFSLTGPVASSSKVKSFIGLVFHNNIESQIIIYSNVSFSRFQWPLRYVQVLILTMNTIVILSCCIFCMGSFARCQLSVYSLLRVKIISSSSAAPRGTMYLLSLHFAKHHVEFNRQLLLVLDMSFFLTRRHDMTNTCKKQRRGRPTRLILSSSS